MEYLKRNKRTKPYQMRKRVPLITVDKYENSNSDSYVDDNLSDVCRALMLASGASESRGLRSSQKGDVFSDTFSFNKERDENEL